MHDMPMPGGETMSGLVSVLMMAAMMLPSSALMLRRDRGAAAGRGETHLFRRSAMVGTGYFLAWIAISVAVVPLGDMLAHVTPIAAGAIVLIAGTFQFTSWKTRQLECWRDQSTGRRAPLRQGLRLAIHCARCCGNLMAILLVIGAMDMRAMAVVTAAITAERVVPAGDRVARVIGVVVVAAGAFKIARAIALTS
jgi:predicted metal-binding membrane protein